MDGGVESGDDLARLEVPEVDEVLGVQALEEQRPAVRVGPQQPDRAVPTDALQPQRLVLGLVVGEAQLEHRRSLGGPHRQHQRAVARRGGAVRGQVPLLDELAH